MPDNYTTYVLAISGDIVFRDGCEPIFQWTNATELRISGENMLPLALQQRRDQLQRLDRLQKIVFDISELIFDRLDVATFVKSLPSLTEAVFYRKGINADLFNAFVQQQRVPSGWEYSIIFGGGQYSFDRP